MSQGKTSIGIIGMGWVGSSVAISILHRGICSELLLNDARPGLAEGEAMDLTHGSSFYPTTAVRAAHMAEMKDCKAIVITAGRGGSPDESRLDLLNDNIAIAKKIATELQGFGGILIIVTNPVDVLTYYYQQFSGLAAGRVIGTGTMLDTARLRELIGRKVDVDPRNIHANFIGEHGDSGLALWSSADIGGMKLRDFKTWQPEFEADISEKVRTAAYQIIRRKGATNHAIGLVTATLLKWVLRGDRRIINLSSVMNGIYGLKDLAISLPTLISEEGIIDVLEAGMNKKEEEQFFQSAEVLKTAIETTSY